MHCPCCERPTYRSIRVGNHHFRPANAPEGSVLAALLDGTCYTCRRIQQGVREPRRAPIVRHRMSEEEVQRCNQAYQRYAARRRARGVPREGLHPSTLVRPGLFLMEVN